MAKQLVDIGTGPDDNTGDHMRGAFTKCNSNFDELFSLFAGNLDLVGDLTPQLGGDLDVNGKSIVSVTAGDIAITPDTTGNVILDGLNWPQADGAAGEFLKTDGGGQLSWAADAAGIASVSADLAPALGGDLTVAGNAIVSTAAGDIVITPDTTGKTIVTNLEAPAPQQTQIGTTYVPVLADADKMITMFNAAATTVTIPANSSVAYPIGTKLNFMQLSLDANPTTIDITTDALNVNAALTLVLNGQYAVATAMKITATSWVLFGNLVAA